MTWYEAVPTVRRRVLGVELEFEPRNSDSFHTGDALDINATRVAHLDTLGIDWTGKRVLDVGSGPGLLAEQLVARGADVMCIDGRADLLDEAKRRVPSLDTGVADVQRDPLLPFGRFDVVFAYGLLYHLAEPLRALRNMVAVCDGMLLLETITLDHPLPLVELADEPAQANQAVDGLACRPTPSWIALALERSGLGMVYGTTADPAFRDFGAPPQGDLKWEREGANLRRIFVAARGPLELDGIAPLAEGVRRSPAAVVIAAGERAIAAATQLVRRDPTAVAYCLAASATDAEVLNRRLPNLHAWSPDAAAAGLGAFCDTLRIARVARLYLDDAPHAAELVGSLGDRLDGLDEAVLFGPAPTGSRTGAEADAPALLGGAGLEQHLDAASWSVADGVRFRRPRREPVAITPVSWADVRTGDDAVVEPGDGWLEVVTPPVPWSTGAMVPLPEVGEGAHVLRVTLRVLEGRLGLALMRSLSELSTERPLDASPDDQVVDLPFLVTNDARDLLVRNYANAGSARCRIVGLEIRAE